MTPRRCLGLSQHTAPLLLMLPPPPPPHLPRTRPGNGPQEKIATYVAAEENDL